MPYVHKTSPNAIHPGHRRDYHRRNMSATDEKTATSQSATPFLRALFGAETVTLAASLDTAILDMNDDMTKAVAAGVARLKTMRGNIAAQQKYIASLQEGARLLLCLWIMDMELTDKMR